MVSSFSGVVDEHDAVQPEGLSGPLGEVLGVRVHEFAPLAAGDRVALSMWDGPEVADVWTDRLVISDPATEVLGTFTDGPAAGRPALTRRSLGAGAAWYLATRLDVDGLARVLRRVYPDAGADPGPVLDLPEDVEIVTRHGDPGSFRFLINQGDKPADVPALGVDAITGVEYDGTVPACGVRVVRAG